jgi:tetratricopeptide (TPR) repeat protein
MNIAHFTTRAALGLSAAVIAVFCLSGCYTGLSYNDLRTMGQEQMIQKRYGVARDLLSEAMEMKPEDPWNLYDLGDCCTYLAKEQFHRRNVPVAMNYVDNAVEYYSRAINAYPGMEPALMGKNMALELKQQFEEALSVAAWAATFVGPNARQQIFLAHELEERADLDAALLRYRQALSIEPESAYAHAQMGLFMTRIGREEDAITHLRTAYGLNPDEPDVLPALRKLGAEP